MHMEFVCAGVLHAGATVCVCTVNVVEHGCGEHQG